jgi:c(7)-type cytochrome triheme protein
MSRLALIGLLVLLFNATTARAQGVRDNELPEAKLFQSLPVVTANFPKGIDGRPDWVQALGKGLISPRSTKSGEPRAVENAVPMPTAGIVFTNTQFMPYVVFPHQPHAEWLTCMNCHESLFELKATGKGKGMTAIFRGEHCGFCHGRVAFAPEGSCYRCHSQPNPAAVRNNSPFTAPAVVESAVVEDPEPMPRRRGRKAVPMYGRLAPSVVPPPKAPTPLPTPELQ